MLFTLGKRRLHYDLLGPSFLGPASVRTVCFAHALAADSGMWAEQVPAVLALGLRVLRVDMRGHGGSDACAGDYSLQSLASDIVALMDGLGIAQVDYVGLSIGGMIGEALAVHYTPRVASLMLCETPPAALRNADQIWGPRVAAVRAAGSLEPIADATMERWLTPHFKARNPQRWQQIRDTIAASSVAGARSRRWCCMAKRIAPPRMKKTSGWHRLFRAEHLWRFRLRGICPMWRTRIASTPSSPIGFRANR